MEATARHCEEQWGCWQGLVTPKIPSHCSVVTIPRAQSEEDLLQRTHLTTWPWTTHACHIRGAQPQDLQEGKTVFKKDLKEESFVSNKR